MSKRDALRRRRPFRNPLPRVLIVCEGTRTEPGYFHDLRHTERIPIELEISPGGVPKTLVQRAVQLKNAAQKEAKIRQDENLLYDDIWCVFDIDEHPAVPDGKRQARDNEINLAISNPCFELWILLHFRDQRAHIDRTVVRRECIKYFPITRRKYHLACFIPITTRQYNEPSLSTRGSRPAEARDQIPRPAYTN